MTGPAYLPDGRIVFSTHVGQLYVDEPRADAPARVSALGWLHPQGQGYAPSLFSFGGSEWLAGVVRRQKGFEWVVYEMRTRLSAAFPLDTEGLRVLLYGSTSRDDAGRVYVGGWAANGHGGQRPLLLQIDPGG
jgi:hypothetical protein